MSTESEKAKILKIPKATDSLETYKEYAKENMISVFQLDSEASRIPLEEYIKNMDHGAEHTYNVYKKALEIASSIEKETNISVENSLLYIMSGMHDSGRFRLPIYKEGDTQKQIQAKEQKRKNAERNHGRYGVAQIKLGINKNKQNNLGLSSEDQNKIEDYITNHDFFNKRLDGEKYNEPQSLEGQITRLSDRISVPIEEEIKRYWETGKRMGTTYFNKDISWQERADFSFANMGNYIKTGKFDEFTFFLSLLSQKSSDFSNPILARIYQEWAVSKQQGIDCILQIAKEEGYTDEDIQEMQQLIKKYLKYFKIDF